MDGVVNFFLDPANWNGTTGIPNRLFEHLVISGLAFVVASLIAIPTGLYIGHTNRASGVAINFANVGRAIPSYAMMVIPLPLTLALAPVLGYDPTLGLAFLPILLAMIFLAVPPLLLATYSGCAPWTRARRGGPRHGLDRRQILTRIELPLSSSIIVGGFRTATLQVIATATIGAILAGGGLGRFIFDGLNQGLAGRASIYAGAILVAGLAIFIDYLLSLRPAPAHTPRRCAPNAPRPRGELGAGVRSTAGSRELGAPTHFATGAVDLPRATPDLAVKVRSRCRKTAAWMRRKAACGHPACWRSHSQL